MTELIWDGKYTDGNRQGPIRIALPFQTIETINESAKDRQRRLELFAARRDTEWRNRLIWGDKKYVLPSLLPEFAGKVKLVYIDPPFDTGADFSYVATVPIHPGSEDDEAASFVKEPSILEQKAYRDTWGRGLDSYLQWFYETAVFLRDLLSTDGSIYVHLDWHIGHYAKVVLDEVFGSNSFGSEIVWKRTTSHSDATSYGSVHDTILFYAAPGTARNEVLQAYDKDYIEAYYRYKEPSGRRFMSDNLTGAGTGPARRFGAKGLIRPPAGRHWMYDQEGIDLLLREGGIYWTKNNVPRLKTYLDNSPGMSASDLWDDIQPIRSWHKEEDSGYDTQKPEALLDRIVRASTKEEELVLDCFVGSGTTAVVAEKLGRRWIACDLSRFAIHTTRKRLLGIPSVKPYVVQNLGKYERQAWQVAEFPANGENRLEEQRQREAAYQAFILDLFHATPISGNAWLSGTKGGRMVHVGAVDAPVTLADVKAIAREAWKAFGSSQGAASKTGVDILGWEFAFEVNELAKQVAAESRVDVAFRKIPREVLDKKAVEQGDVKFFELGALSVDVKQKHRESSLKLTDFVIPTDDIPEEARKAVRHWSQLIDYWAVDWDFKGDTFHNQWQTYRTRREPKIELETKHSYPEPGKYTIVVKVIDILGNDTTKTLEVKVE